MINNSSLDKWNRLRQKDLNNQFLNEIVEKWLLGSEYTEIGRSTCHSVSAIRNYVDKFKRIIALYKERGHPLEGRLSLTIFLLMGDPFALIVPTVLKVKVVDVL
tara:strand:+ start:184 stop:495 length:312 start_codon:yes stop_codon:yes gene_type:complete